MLTSLLKTYSASSLVFAGAMRHQKASQQGAHASVHVCTYLRTVWLTRCEGSGVS